MLRVGSVPYLVGRPLDVGLDLEPGIEFFTDVPARLVAGLRDGSVDVALVSSIELFRRPGYSFLDGPCVAGESTVTSVQVFLRRPVEECRRVALDPASRTARALTQVVWPTEGEARPTFLDVPLGTDPRSVEADAWLRIGDAALREHLAPDALPTFNPSRAWRERTGLPFVFAPWIAAPGVDLEALAPTLVRAAERGAGELEALADRAAEAWGVPAEATRAYLTEECLYDPGTRTAEALFAYGRAAVERGLADPEARPRAVPARP